MTAKMQRQLQIEVFPAETGIFRNKRKFYIPFCLLSFIFPTFETAVFAQGLQNMPRQILNHQGSYVPNAMGATPGTVGAGSVGANIWNSVGNSRIPIGTVLSGILEDDLSSGKNNRGDVFSIRLEDGYFNNGVEVLPRHSRIVGAVVHVVPSKLTGHGHPGNLQVSLQTIVFPDGRNTPLSGFIVHNPNMDELQNPMKSSAATAASYYPRATANSLGILGRTLAGRAIGFKPGFRARGADFTMEKGEILAVRLNRSLDLTHLSPAPTGFSPSNIPVPGLSSPTVPALTSGQPLLPASQAPAVAPPIVPNQAGATNSNPNQLFNNPLGPKPGANIPDPF